MEYLILPISGDIVVLFIVVVIIVVIIVVVIIVVIDDDIVIVVGILGVVGVRLKTTPSTIPLNTIMITKDTIAIFFPEK